MAPSQWVTYLFGRQLSTCAFGRFRTVLLVRCGNPSLPADSSVDTAIIASGLLPIAPHVVTHVACHGRRCLHAERVSLAEPSQLRRHCHRGRWCKRCSPLFARWAVALVDSASVTSVHPGAIRPSPFLPSMAGIHPSTGSYPARLARPQRRVLFARHMPSITTRVGAIVKLHGHRAQVHTIEKLKLPRL